MMVAGGGGRVIESGIAGKCAHPTADRHHCGGRGECVRASVLAVCARGRCRRVRSIAVNKLLVMAAAMAVALGGSTAHSEVPMEKVAASERSGVAEARQVVVRSEAQWQQLWDEIAPRRPKPQVDLTARMIIGVFLGERPTSGYSVQIMEVREEPDGLRVKYAERAPAPGAMVMQVLTSPFSLISVPARTGDVRFEQVPAAPQRLLR